MRMKEEDRIKVAILAAIPAELLPALNLTEPGVDVDRDFASCGSLVTVEAYFVRALLARKDVKVDVITCDRAVKNPETIPLNPGHGSLHRLPAHRGSGMTLGWVPRARGLRAYLRALDVDLVHGFRTDYGYASMAALSGMPHLITIEGFIEDSPRARQHSAMFTVGALAEKHAIAHAEAVMAISDHVAQRIRGIARGKLIRIPNMVGDLFFETDRIWPQRKVVYVGRVTPEKGLHDMLAAARLLDRAGVGEIQWVVVGGPTGPGSERYMERCLNLARDLRHSVVEMKGWLPNHQVADVLRDATCAVFPYQAPYETFAIAVPEAMAASVPVVVNDSGPLPEHVDDGRSGYIVSPGDVEELASRVLSLLDDPAQSFLMGAEARRRVQAYRPSRVTDQLIGAYRSIASAG